MVVQYLKIKLKHGLGMRVTRKYIQKLPKQFANLHYTKQVVIYLATKAHFPIIP